MEQKVCPRCGAQVDPNDASCRYCGEVFAQQNTYQAQQTQYNPQQGQYQAQQGQYSQQQYAAQPRPYDPATQKSKVAAGVLGILLGGFGVHNFYLGFTGKAIAQLLITVLSCGILSEVSWIWGLVEGIMILTGNSKTDAKGIPLRD